LTTYIFQGSVATYLRGGGSYNSIFLCRSFVNLTVKKIMKIGPRCWSFHRHKRARILWETVYLYWWTIKLWLFKNS